MWVYEGLDRQRHLALEGLDNQRAQLEVVLTARAFSTFPGLVLR